MSLAIAWTLALAGCGPAPAALAPEVTQLPGTETPYRVGQRRPASPTPAPTATPAPSPNGTVLYVAPQGQDTNPGTSASPLRTISAAASKATPGTTVLIAGGTYPEQVVTRVGGSAGQEITFKSYNGTAVLDGSQLAWTPAGNQNQGLFELRHPYVRLDGLKIANSKNTGVVLAADHLTVMGCEVANAQRHAISTDTGRQTGVGGRMIQDITLDGNVVHDATLAGSGNGQAISLIADGFTIRGNRVYANRDIGIDVWLGSRHGEVVANTVYNNPNAAGIYVDGASYVRIHRNTVYGNKNGIGVSSEDTRYSTARIWVYNNVVYDHPTSSGCYIWDPDQGATEVLFAFNTLINNKNAFYLTGSGNSAEICNNIGYSVSSGLYDSSTSSTYRTHHNLWLGSITGFVAPGSHDYRLTSSSPAVNQGQGTLVLVDDLGNQFPIDTDCVGTSRTVGGAPDLGAYELP